MALQTPGLGPIQLGLLTLSLGLALACSRLGAAPIRSALNPTEAKQSVPLTNAVKAFHRGDRAATLRFLERAQREQPELAPAEVVLATMYFSDDKPAEGRRMLEQAAFKHPTDPESHLIFGDLAHQQRRWTDAQLQYERGDQLTKQYTGPPQRKRNLQVRAALGLANVAEARGQMQEAHKWFSVALKLDPAQAPAHYRIGNVLFALGRPDEALDEFRAAAELVESAPSAPLTLAELYKRAGDLEQGQAMIEQAIEESPDDFRAPLAMARWQLEVLSDPPSAVKHVERAAQLDPTSLEPPMLQGVIAWSLGDLERAERLFESVALKQPTHAEANNFLAAVLAEQGDPDQLRRAWELVEVSVGVNPRSADAGATAGWVAYHQGKLEQAEQQLRRTAMSASHRRDALYYLARTLFRQGQIADAQTALEQALTAKGLFVHLREANVWQKKIGKPEPQP